MTDKLLHFLAGALVALAGALLFNPAAGVVGAIVAGALKEAYDIRAGTVDAGDFVVTAMGGAVCGLALAIGGFQ